MFRHSCYPSFGQRRLWRLADALPGRRVLAAIWSWL
jgi:hypothetical protein